MSDIFIPIVGADYPKKVIPLLDNAKKNIDLISYDWRWYPNQPGHVVQQFNIALVNAVRRGVIVRAVVNRVEILPTLANVGIVARKMRDKRTLHTKLVIIDSEILVIGSHNFTRNAFGSNVETSIAVSIPPGETRFQNFFDTLFLI